MSTRISGVDKIQMDETLHRGQKTPTYDPVLKSTKYHQKIKKENVLFSCVLPSRAWHVPNTSKISKARGIERQTEGGREERAENGTRSKSSSVAVTSTETQIFVVANDTY